MDLKQRQAHFEEVFSQQYAWMHRRLSLGLLSVKKEKEALIKDLIQDIACKTWQNYCKPEYMDTSLVYLFRQKTDNVLKDYFKKKKLVPLGRKANSLATPSFQNALEAQDLINYLQRDQGVVMNLFVCQLRAEGYSYKEIRSRLKLPSSPKMNICRFRKKLRSSGLSPF
jgi:hypothetical protein